MEPSKDLTNGFFVACFKRRSKEVTEAESVMNTDILIVNSKRKLEADFKEHNKLVPKSKKGKRKTKNKKSVTC